VLCRRPVIFEAGDVRLAEVKLPDRGSIRGQISSLPTGLSSAFEEMWFSDSKRTKSIQVFTDQKGEFIIEDVVPGKWFVGEGDPRSTSLHVNGHDVYETIVASNRTTQCDFARQERLSVEIPRRDFRKNSLVPKTESLVVGDDFNTQLVANFSRRLSSHAELLLREENRHLIRVTMHDAGNVEIVYRELVLEKGATVLQCKDSDTTVFVHVTVPGLSKNVRKQLGDQTIVSFAQNGIETNRIIRTVKDSNDVSNGNSVSTLDTDLLSKGVHSSMIAKGDYDISIHNDSGWAKLKCTISGNGVVELGPIECQLGGSIVGRISLADKLAYPSSVRATPQDGCVLERELTGNHEEPFQFTGLTAGIWRIELIDNTQSLTSEVMKSATVEVLGTETMELNL